MTDNIHQKRALKFLFISRCPTHLHSYNSIIEALTKRGHTVELLFDTRWSQGDPLTPVDQFAARTANFSYSWAISRFDRWRTLLFYTRELRTYRRYLTVKEQVQSTYYRDRWQAYLPAMARRMLCSRLVQTLFKSRICGLFLNAVEYIAPADASIIADIKKRNPDVVVPGPVNMRFSSVDLEYQKAAQKLGIFTVLPVLSWDNLTTKGLIHIKPDILLCWNDVQKEEARVHHGIDVSRIRIIGAPVFDGWFAHMRVSSTRSEFCARYGLREEDLIILYLGSSSNMAKDESWLIKQVRSNFNNASDARLRRAQLVVRPHPSNYKIYTSLDMPGISLIPQEGALPNTVDALTLFYDSLYHAACAVVGVNTSSVIETVIADKPVVALLTDYYRKTQIETQHFQQLLEINAVASAGNLDEAIKFLKQLADGRDEWQVARAAFVKKYIRPYGRDESAGERAADEIERAMYTWRINRV